jgi:tol-pal system protein YbgF
MRRQWVVYLGVAMLAGATGGLLLAPAPVGAVNREIVELQQSIAQVIQGQMALQTALTQSEAVQKTLIEQSLDSVNKLSGAMSGMQKTVEDMQATSGARLDSMATQIQGVSDNLQEMQARMGKLNQQLTDAQTAIQGIDAKISAAAPPPPSADLPPDAGNPAAASPTYPPAGAPPTGSSPTSSGPGAYAPNVPAPTAPSADLLYSNALRDLTGRKYDLASSEFHDYLKYYSATDLASNAQFYLGEIYFAQMQFDQAIDAYSKVIDNFPKSFKLPSAHLKKGLALAALGQKASAIRELRIVVKLYPSTEEDRRARAKLKELGITA